jgi:23S rRNA pseudouridine2605 synthase
MKNASSRPTGNRGRTSRSSEDRPQRSRPDGERPSTGRPSTGRPSTGRPSTGRPVSDRPYKGRPTTSRSSEERPQRSRPAGERPSTGRPTSDRPYGDRPYRARPTTSRSSEERPQRSRPAGERPSTGRPTSDRPYGDRPYRARPDRDRPTTSRTTPYRKPYTSKSARLKPSDGTIRLNKYIANAGVCSRREADVLISSGSIKVNGKIVTELGTKIQPEDVVLYGDQRLVNEKKIYLLLNKPKDYITTVDDPQERKTVLHLVQSACRERVYPVGRLDRNTTGLLLLTNDGEMTKRLTHPSHNVQKLYHAQLDKALTKADMASIMEGVRIDDQLVVPDELAYVSGSENRKEVGIAIHSGQNRVVRRIFEEFGYRVERLDRVSFAGLTKKDLPRGKWRFLTEKEVSFLKMR